MDGCRQRARALVSWITVEPVEFLYCLMFSVSNVVRDNLFLDKVCLLDLKYSEETCYNLTHGQDVGKNITNAVQSKVADLEIIDGILMAIPAVLFCLFVGAWSDANGRKPVLILPFAGNILSFLVYMINYHWFDEIPSGHLLWGSVAGLTGGYVCLNIGLYGYVSDVTNSDNRTMRLSILNGVFSAGYVVGVTIGGKIFKYAESYYLNFGLSCVFGLLGLLYSIFFVRESVVATGPNSVDDASKRRGFFDLNNVRDSLYVAFKPRPNHGRANVILLIMNFAIFMFCLNTTHYDYLLVIARYFEISLHNQVNIFIYNRTFSGTVGTRATIQIT
jgi:MFS family permease